MSDEKVGSGQCDTANADLAEAVRLLREYQKDLLVLGIVYDDLDTLLARMEKERGL